MFDILLEAISGIIAYVQIHQDVYIKYVHFSVLIILHKDFLKKENPDNNMRPHEVFKGEDMYPLPTW